MMIKVLLSMLLSLFLSGMAHAADTVKMTKPEFKQVYFDMMVATAELADDSPLSAMGGTPNPYVLVYSVERQRFISDREKFDLLQFNKLREGALTGLPVLIQNRPEQHPFFTDFAFEKLRHYLPKASAEVPYIVFLATQNQRSARATESLLTRARAGVESKNHVPVPELVKHLDQVLKEQPWQVFKYQAKE